MPNYSNSRTINRRTKNIIQRADQNRGHAYTLTTFVENNQEIILKFAEYWAGLIVTENALKKAIKSVIVKKLQLQYHENQNAVNAAANSIIKKALEFNIPEKKEIGLLILLQEQIRRISHAKRDPNRWRNLVNIGLGSKTQITLGKVLNSLASQYPVNKKTDIINTLKPVVNNLYQKEAEVVLHKSTIEMSIILIMFKLILHSFSLDTNDTIFNLALGFCLVVFLSSLYLAVIGYSENQLESRSLCLDRWNVLLDLTPDEAQKIQIDFHEITFCIPDKKKCEKILEKPKIQKVKEKVTISLNATNNTVNSIFQYATSLSSGNKPLKRWQRDTSNEIIHNVATRPAIHHADQSFLQNPSNTILDFWEEFAESLIPIDNFRGCVKYVYLNPKVPNEFKNILKQRCQFTGRKGSQEGIRKLMNINAQFRLPIQQGQESAVISPVLEYEYKFRREEQRLYGFLYHGVIVFIKEGPHLAPNNRNVSTIVAYDGPDPIQLPIESPKRVANLHL